MSLLSFTKTLQSPPAKETIQDPLIVKHLYHRMRLQTMGSMLIGYAGFYLVRKNFSMAMPSFLQELHLTKTDLGLILTMFSIIYGIGKFANGMLADRANARYFMALGLFGAAVMNICFGLSASLTFLGIFWLGNAYFQSMGWPPCARLLTHWFHHRELGTWWGIWNASHQIGGAGIMILAGYLIPHHGWRSAFIIPALISLLLVLLLVIMLRDTPSSIGLPPIEQYKSYDDYQKPSESQLPFREIFFKHILLNRPLWIICAANFFVYIVRIGVLDWAPTFLVEAKQGKLLGAGFSVAGFEIAGIIGAFIAGLLSDRVFKGRRGPTNVIFMIPVIACLLYFWKMPAGFPVIDGLVLAIVGFFIYGPQMLVGVAAADFAKKEAAATATGLSGTFGYLGSAACGIGTGLIVDTWGWNGGFIFFLSAACIATFLFLFTWRLSPNHT